MTAHDPMSAMRRPIAPRHARHFAWSTAHEGQVGIVTLSRPERKNPLTFDAYAELRDLFRDLTSASDVRAVVVTGAGGNFCSGGDVHEIIEPLTRMAVPELLAFTRMTGDLVKAMRACPQPIIAAVDGVAAGAGAILALAADLRLATPAARTAFLFTRVGLAGCDMGACAILPRLIGQGRASELLFTGRVMSAEEGERWGFYNAIVPADSLLRRGHDARRGAGERSRLRARDDQDDAAAGVERLGRSGHRDGSAGAGAVHGHAGLPAGLRGVRRQALPGLRGQLIVDRVSHLDWPFLDDRHRALAREAAAWAGAQQVPRGDVDQACREWTRRLGAAGFLRYTVPGAWGGALDQVDSRALCVVRETLAAHDGLADFAFAMQGLGSGAIALAGSDELRRSWLPKVAAGEAIAAFALSEPGAGSDAGALTTRAERVEGGWRLDGDKTWISNGGIADFYCVFARTDAASQGAKGISAFFVPATSPGLAITGRIDVISPHPLASLRFTNCVVDDGHLLGEAGRGFGLAMRTLDVFRVSVAAAAVGFARRALAETLAHARTRQMFGATLAAQPLAQAILGDMATDLDAAALLTYRAAWQRDMVAGRSHERRRDGQAGRHREGPGDRRSRRPAPRWTRRARRQRGRAAVSRRAGAAHLRGGVGGAAPHHRP